MEAMDGGDGWRGGMERRDGEEGAAVRRQEEEWVEKKERNS
jgi:hypothetical protein